jgi:hypothetical protein
VIRAHCTHLYEHERAIKVFYIIISAPVSAGERKTNRIMAAYILMPWLKFWIFSKQTHLDFCPISLLSVHPFLSMNGIPEHFSRRMLPGGKPYLPSGGDGMVNPWMLRWRAFKQPGKLKGVDRQFCRGQAPHQTVMELQQSCQTSGLDHLERPRSTEGDGRYRPTGAFTPSGWGQTIPNPPARRPRPQGGLWLDCTACVRTARNQHQT